MRDGCRPVFFNTADVVFMDELPHTGMGKIDYRKLAKDYDERLDREAAAN